MGIFDKSYEIIKKLIHAQKRENFSFILIGGWAVWVYNQYMKSKDIDIIIEKQDFWKLSNFLKREGFTPLVSAHLGKKAFNKLWNADKIEIDVYDEKISEIDIKEISKVKKKLNSEQIFVPEISDLMLLKCYSAMQRLGTAKGEKDLSDTLALIEKYYNKIDWDKIANRLGKKETKDLLRTILGNFVQTKKFYPLTMADYKKIKRFLGIYMD